MQVAEAGGEGGRRMPAAPKADLDSSKGSQQGQVEGTYDQHWDRPLPEATRKKVSYSNQDCTGPSMNTTLLDSSVHPTAQM